MNAEGNAAQAHSLGVGAHIRARKSLCMAAASTLLLSARPMLTFHLESHAFLIRAAPTTNQPPTSSIHGMMLAYVRTQAQTTYEELLQHELGVCARESDTKLVVGESQMDLSLQLFQLSNF